ncbi:hypothetical protein PMAYCL1PPCAC_00028, partial [Pristionchus mayeri]
STSVESIRFRRTRSRAMQTSHLIYTISVGSVVVSVVQLCFAASIFDFIVMNKKFYESVNNEILIDPGYALYFFGASLLSASLGLLTISAISSHRRIKNCIARHNTVLAGMHAFLLVVAAVSLAECYLLASRLSENISPYAHNGTPESFQEASCWYFRRLRASMELFGLQSVCASFQLFYLYTQKGFKFMGINQQPYAKLELI